MEIKATVGIRKIKQLPPGFQAGKWNPVSMFFEATASPRSKPGPADRGAAVEYKRAGDKPVGFR